MKIMIVEDDHMIRDLLGDMLEKWNFEVIKLEEFDHVLETFLNEKPHLLLLDINLLIFQWISLVQ